MKGVRELKRRLKGVQNIRKITKAIELVAGTKLRRLQDRAAATRPFASQLDAIMKRVAGFIDPDASPLLRERSVVKDVALVVIAGDKGLCGSYNSNVFRAAVPFIRARASEGRKVHVFALGRRAAAFFAKLREVDLAYVHPDPIEKIEFRALKLLMKDLVAGFLADKFQEVHILYTSVKGSMNFKPVAQRVIPVPKPEAGEDKTAAREYILEPSPAEIMERLLPRFLEMQLFAAVLESLAAEFASRRIAMKSATDNAGEMIGTLNKEYNKARQSGITSELLEISGGAEALRSAS